MMALAESTLTAEVIVRTLVQGGRSVACNRQNALALRLAKHEGCYPEVLAAVLDARRQNLRGMILIQRDWGTKVSRRPQRGNHHDSWAMREAYVRADGTSYAVHLPYAHSVQERFGVPAPFHLNYPKYRKGAIA